MRLTRTADVYCIAAGAKGNKAVGGASTDYADWLTHVSTYGRYASQRADTLVQPGGVNIISVYAFLFGERNMLLLLPRSVAKGNSGTE